MFGALGMVFYGFVRNTEDLDVVVDPDQENLNRVAEWLMSIDAELKLNPERRFGLRERWGMHKGSNATLLTRFRQVDVVQRIPRLPGWPALVEQAEMYELDGRPVRAMNRRP